MEGKTMHLTIYNGSPRRKKSNTETLINSIINGFRLGNNNTFSAYYLADKKSRNEQIKAFEDGEIIIIAMPLYCDAMPSIVKEFIEALPTKTKNPQRKLGFIVQSGFEESHQSSFLKAYLDSLPKFFPCVYMGTVIKGGVEGINNGLPQFMVKPILNKFFKLGITLAQKQYFDEEITAQLAKPYKYSKTMIFFYKLLLSKFSNGYWNRQLKANGCYNDRYNAPYAQGIR